MSLSDLHVHSKFSDSSSEWFLKKVGSNESYTEVEDVYRLATERGMDFVTLTDHNSIGGALEMVKSHPENTFISSEITTRFPDNGCKIHLLVFDINPIQFEGIIKRQNNIYLLRDFIKNESIAHSVAHATYSVNGKLTFELLEKLILLFDVFEGTNGARNAGNNLLWTKVLSNLTASDINRLYAKHGIPPFSSDPWIKGLTGGSDDHSGLFIGKTFTKSEALTKKDFIESLKDKRTMSSGRNNDFKGMAFTFAKIAHEFSKRKTVKTTRRNKWAALNKVVFDSAEPTWVDRLALMRMRCSKDLKRRTLAKFMSGLISDLSGKHNLPVEERIDVVYQNVSDLVDNYFKLMFNGMEDGVHDGDVTKLFKYISSGFSNILISAPFVTLLRHFYANQDMLRQLHQEFLSNSFEEEKRFLWFTDTIDDMNGVTVTLKNFSRKANEKKLALKLVCCRPNGATPLDFPHLVLPEVNRYTPEFYSSYTMLFPSFLKSLEMIQAENPTEIIISTPGPVGVIGLLASKLMGIKSVGIFHTDFSKQMELDADHGMVSQLLEKYLHWFYGQVDEIRVPTKEYIQLLSNRNYDRSKMKVFKRGVDTNVLKQNPGVRAKVQRTYNMRDGFTLLYAGRISKDKNMDFLADIYRQVLSVRKDVNLIIAGHGPYLNDMRKKMQDCPRAVFTDRLKSEEMVNIYSASDLFVFPSTTDTFGMVILEAQACSLPCLVTDQGGPQEIVSDKKTGWVLPVGNVNAWAEMILKMIDMQEKDPNEFRQLRAQCRKLIVTKFNWDNALMDIFNITCERKKMKKNIKLRDREPSKSDLDTSMATLN